MNNKVFRAIVYSTLYITQLYSNPIPKKPLKHHKTKLYANPKHTTDSRKSIKFIYSGTDTEAQKILQSHMNMKALGNTNSDNPAKTPKTIDSKFRKHKYASTYEHSLYRRYCSAYKSRLYKNFERARTAQSPHDALQHARNYQSDLQANIKLVLDVQKALMERKNDFPKKDVSKFQLLSIKSIQALREKEKTIQDLITQNQQIINNSKLLNGCDQIHEFDFEKDFLQCCIELI